MKFQSVRKQLIIAGFTAALLFSGVAKAQEITNSTFPDGPSTAPFAQPVATQPGVAAKAAPGANDKMTMVDASVSASPNAPLPQAPDNEERPDKLMWTGLFLVWIGAVGLYFSGPAKRLTEEMRRIRSLKLTANASNR
jgi:hypothetical protein